MLAAGTPMPSSPRRSNGGAAASPPSTAVAAAARGRLARVLLRPKIAAASVARYYRRALMSTSLTSSPRSPPHAMLPAIVVARGYCDARRCHAALRPGSSMLAVPAADACAAAGTALAMTLLPAIAVGHQCGRRCRALRGGADDGFARSSALDAVIAAARPR